MMAESVRRTLANLNKDKGMNNSDLKKQSEQGIYSAE